MAFHFFLPWQSDQDILDFKEMAESSQIPKSTKALLPDICSEPPPAHPSPPVPLPANIYLKGHSLKISRSRAKLKKADDTMHGQINIIDTKAKCRHLKNLPVKGLCGRCLSVWGSLPSFDAIPYTPPYTLYTYIRVYCIPTYSHRERGGGGKLTREKVRGATIHKAGSKIPTWLTVSPVYKHLPQSPFTGQFF